MQWQEIIINKGDPTYSFDLGFLCLRTAASPVPVTVWGGEVGMVGGREGVMEGGCVGGEGGDVTVVRVGEMTAAEEMSEISWVKSGRTQTSKIGCYMYVNIHSVTIACIHVHVHVHVHSQNTTVHNIERKKKDILYLMLLKLKRKF